MPACHRIFSALSSYLVITPRSKLLKFSNRAKVLLLGHLRNVGRF